MKQSTQFLRFSGWFGHALLIALALTALVWPYALKQGRVGVFLGAILGCFLAEHLSRRRFRLPVLLGLALLCVGLAELGQGLMLQSPALARHMGPESMLQIADGFWGFFGAMAMSGALRALASRVRMGILFEGLLALGAVASVVSDHRDGLIARPRFVSDAFWFYGLDPRDAFWAIGFLAVLLAAGVLLRGRNQSSGLLVLLLMLLLGGSFLLLGRTTMPHWLLSAAGGEAENEPGDPNETPKDDPKGGSGSGEGGSGNQEDSNIPPPPKQDESPPVPVAVVLFFDEARPRSGLFHFRESTLSQLEGHRLSQSADLSRAYELSFKPRAPAQDDKPSTPALPSGLSWVRTQVVELERRPQAIQLIEGREIQMLKNPDPQRFKRAYAVDSRFETEGLDGLLGHVAGEEAWPDEVWGSLTDLPADDRLFQLATRLQLDLAAEYDGDPVALGLLVKRYLEHGSTMSGDVPFEGEDPVGDFLFREPRVGYAPHYAHAAVYLLRAMGIPARVAIGYAVEASRLGDGSSLLIENQDRHIWAELYVSERGWVPLEIQPEHSTLKERSFSREDMQQMYGEMARLSPEDPEDKPFDLRAALTRAAWIFVFGMLLSLYGVKLWRLYRPGQNQRLLLAYRAALDRLSMVNQIRPYGMSIERFGRQQAELSPSFGVLSEVVSASVFGATDRPFGDPEVSIKALRRWIRQDLRRTQTFERRLLGWLNPLSWLKSR